MTLQSRYFTVDEFRCHDGTEYPADWIGDRLQSLCSQLDLLRDAWGGPLTVICGYRTAAYNARLAARSSDVALKSQHVQGRAADIRPAAPTPERVRELHRLCKQMVESGRLPRVHGLGLYPGWIHVDVRAGDHLAEWSGAGVGSEA